MSTYIRTGRGGAGNMLTPGELKKKERDVEAAEASHPHAIANELAKEVSQQNPGEYKHSGRGGAGNWYTPAEGKSEPPAQAPEESPEDVKPVLKPWRGRGGAGNYVGDVNKKEEEELKEVELQERVKKVEEEARKEVEYVLERPGRAHLNPEPGRK